MARFDLVRDVRQSYAEETGEDITRAVAEVIVDQMCDAFWCHVDAEGVRSAVWSKPDVARHLMWRVEGEQGKEIRDALADVENLPAPAVLAEFR